MPDYCFQSVKRFHCPPTALFSFSSSTEKTPEFTTPLKPLKVTQGENATFECKVNKPKAPVTWYKNGVEISPDDEKFSIVQKGAVHQLVVKDCTPDDATEYSAKVADISTDAPLTVKGEGHSGSLHAKMVRLN